MEPLISVPDLPKEYAQEIGFITLETAWIDREILNFIARLAFEDKQHATKMARAECLVAGEPSKILLSKLVKLFTITIDDTALELEFKELVKSISTVYRDRGTYVHSCLYYHEGWTNVPPEVTGFKFQRDMDKKTKEMRKPVKISLTDLTKAANHARKTHNSLVEFMVKIHKYRRSKKPTDPN